MFCPQCGKETPENASFCPSCGYALKGGSASAAPKKTEPTKLVFEVKPIFNALVVMVRVLPIALFFLVWGGGFFGGFSFMAVKFLRMDIPGYMPFVFFGLLFFFGIPIVTVFISQRSYAKTIYQFYNNKLDYFEGFFTVDEKTISYKNVTEVNLRKGILQRQAGLGTIILSTPATASQNGTARSGIHIHDIPNPDEAYQVIKSLI